MDINITLWKTWADLTIKDLLFVAKLYLSGSTAEEIKTVSFLRNAGLKPFNKSIRMGGNYHLFEYKRKKTLIDVQAIAEGASRMSFLLDIPNMGPVKPLKLFGYQRPKEKLFSLSVNQYIHCELFFSEFLEKKKEDYLDKLIACLYVPRFRQFNSYKLKKRTSRLKISRAKKQVILFYYLGARNFLQKQYPLLFNKTSSSSKKDPLSIVRSLNGGDITKNESILKSKLWDAMGQLNDMAETAEKLKNKK